MKEPGVQSREGWGATEKQKGLLGGQDFPYESVPHFPVCVGLSYPWGWMVFLLCKRRNEIVAQSTLDSVYRYGTKVQRRKETCPRSHRETLELSHFTGFLAMKRLYFKNLRQKKKNRRQLYLRKGISESRMILEQGSGVTWPISGLFGQKRF